MIPHLPSPHARGVIAPILLALAVLALAGCFLPDRFEAELVIDDEGEATFGYQGELVYVLGWAELYAERMESDDPEFRAVLETMRDDPAVDRARYQGDARYWLDYRREAAILAGDHIDFPPTGLPLFTVAQGEKGSVELRGLPIAEEDLRELERLGLRFRGTLEVQVDGVVDSHNAHDIGGLFSTVYRWEFDNLRDRPPFLRVSPGAEEGDTMQ